MNWSAIILIGLSLILVLISAIVLGAALRTVPGNSAYYNNYNNSGYYGAGYRNTFLPFGGQLTVNSSNIVAAMVMNIITIILLVILIFVVGARTKYETFLGSLNRPRTEMLSRTT